MFSKVYIAWKKNYGEKIVLKTCSILREHGVSYVFDEPQDCDLAVMIGGDGTLLKYQSSLECPIMGINPGKSVGYYMAAGKNDFENKLRNLLAGSEGKAYFINEYIRLKTSINKTPIPFIALNEVLISPVYVRRILDSELAAKGKRTQERNSGMLVYTPSGSHAYAHSAGARLLENKGKFGVVAIAPYCGRLKKGELTLAKGNVLIKCLNSEGEVCVDGQDEQVCKIKENDVITVKNSGKPARIICFKQPV